MNKTTNKVQSGITRMATIGGSAIFIIALLGEYIAPFLPLIVTVVGSLIIGFIIRSIFIRKLNKRLFSEYRYSNTNTNANAGRYSTQNQTNDTYDETTTKEKIAHDNPSTPPDSLSLYRNLLGLGPQFTADELRAAYHHCAAMYHPDRYTSASPSERQNAEDLMKKVNEAHDRLRSAAL